MTIGHPFEQSIEEMMRDAGIDIKSSKKVFADSFPLGICYDFALGETFVSINLPIVVPSRDTNVVRFEWQVGLIEPKYQYEAIMIISDDLQKFRHTVPVRPVTQTFARLTEIGIYLQFVSQYDFLNLWSVGDLIVNASDLANYYRTLLGETFNSDKSPLNRTA